MPHPMKIQPIDFNDPPLEAPRKCDPPPSKQVSKSRFKRLFERPFSNVLKTTPSSPEEFEPSSLCLAKMVQNFMEESNEKHHKRCNCFNGNCSDSSGDESDSYKSSFSHAYDVLKCLVPCSSVCESNLLADTAKIVERNKIGMRKDGFCRKIVADGLVAVGYKASICKSKWDKSSYVPAGEYEYVDVLMEDKRLILDIDFRSEFEIARSTKAYKRILHILPNIFVGESERLEKIITIVSKAAKQSLKKKGMPFPPWRQADYVKSKWLSSFTRIPSNDRHDLMDDDKNESRTIDEVDSVDNIDLRKWKPLEIIPKHDSNSCKVRSSLRNLGPYTVGSLRSKGGLCDIFWGSTKNTGLYTTARVEYSQRQSYNVSELSSVIQENP